MRQLATSANPTNIQASMVTTAQLKPAIIKTQGHEPPTYNGGSYIKFNNYIIKMEEQFILNNMHEQENVNSQKISYATIFFNET